MLKDANATLEAGEEAAACYCGEANDEGISEAAGGGRHSKYPQTSCGLQSWARVPGFEFPSSWRFRPAGMNFF